MAAAEASFKIWIDSISCGLKSGEASVYMPSMIYSGLLPANVPAPRISILAAPPGVPVFLTVTPGVRPWILSASVLEMFRLAVAALTRPTAPVRSFFLTV